MKQCGAKTRSGEPCKLPALRNGRCRFHGGKSLTGIASPLYKDGRYSKVLPKRLMERYEQAVDDGRLLELRDEIGVVDARLADLLKRVDTGESGALWQALKAAYTDLRDAQAITAPTLRGAKMAEALGLIGDLITQGHADYQAWREIGHTLEQRRRLVESERKRLIELQQVITADRAMLLMNALLESVKQNITDRQQLQAIQQTFNRLTMADEHVIEYDDP